MTEIKNAFNGLFSRLYMSEEGISELQEMSVESSQSKK